MAIELELPTNFDPGLKKALLEERDWEVELVKASNFDIIRADKGAAVECIDGRLAKIRKRKKHGPKIPGQSYCVQANVTGGDLIGFREAGRELVRLGFAPGTHITCGYRYLWESGQLETVTHDFEIPIKTIERILPFDQWVRRTMENQGGKYFDDELGEHEEEALTMNPFINTTLKARLDRFTYDYWVLRQLGVSPILAMKVGAETVEELAPDRKKAEIIIP